MTETVLQPAVISEPGVYSIPEDEYHADCVPGGSLSATSAKYLLPPYTPAHYRWIREHREHKDSFDFGRAAHRIVLEGAAELEQRQVVVVDANDWRTNAAKAAKAAAREVGKAPILRDQWEKLQEMAAALAEHPLAGELFDPARGKAEQALFWRNEQLGIWRRTRLDYLPTKLDGRRLILPDYKTTAGLPDPIEWARGAAEYCYHQQAAAIIEGVKALGLDDDPRVIFVVQSKEAPYLVTVVELDPTAIAIGRNLNTWAMQIFAECQRTGDWPGYDPEVQITQLPAWYLNRFDETPDGMVI